MDDSKKSWNTPHRYLALLALSLPIVFGTCNETRQLIDAPQLSIDISEDDIPDAYKQDVMLNIYACDNPQATCSTSTVPTATVPIGIEVRGRSSRYVQKNTTE